MSELIGFVFKGNRDYVHGTSLFNAIVDAAHKRGITEGKINVSFKQKIQVPICELEQRSATAQDSVIAKIAGGNGEHLTLCINAAASAEKAEREVFDEPEVCRGAALGDMSIFQENPHHKDRIELLVSLCKKMHQELIDHSKKWVFSRYDGEFPIPSANRVELRITRQVGTRLTCTDVLVDDRKIAELYFS